MIHFDEYFFQRVFSPEKPTNKDRVRYMGKSGPLKIDYGSVCPLVMFRVSPNFFGHQNPRESPLISLKKPAEANFLFCQALWDLLSDVRENLGTYVVWV